MVRLHREPTAVLIGEVVAGRVGPGERLPREADLAVRFGVSRGVARECLRALEERGIVAIRHGAGATVLAEDAWNVFDVDVLAALLEAGRGAEVLAQYLECRRTLEVEAAALAAERAGSDDLERLAAAFERMEEAARLPPGRAAEARFHEADLGFHQALVAATANRALGGLVRRINAALLAARYPLARPEHRLRRALPEHRRILEAVADADAGAARTAMAAHLDTVAAYLSEFRLDEREI